LNKPHEYDVLENIKIEGSNGVKSLGASTSRLDIKSTSRMSASRSDLGSTGPAISSIQARRQEITK